MDPKSAAGSCEVMCRPAAIAAKVTRLAEHAERSGGGGERKWRKPGQGCRRAAGEGAVVRAVKADFEGD